MTCDVTNGSIHPLMFSISCRTYSRNEYCPLPIQAILIYTSLNQAHNQIRSCIIVRGSQEQLQSWYRFWRLRMMQKGYGPWRRFSAETSLHFDLVYCLNSLSATLAEYFLRRSGTYSTYQAILPYPVARDPLVFTCLTKPVTPRTSWANLP
jgi:hypothetical protein